MRVNTREMGEIEVAASQVLEFTNPMLGFPSCRRYVLLPVAEAPPFHWLQSIERPDLAFPVIPAGEVGVRYAPGSGTKGRVGAVSDKDMTFWVTATFSTSETPMRVNLHAPVAINRRRRLAAQVVCCDELPAASEAAASPARELCLLHA